LKNVLITLGDSFTYGEGLDYFLMKDKYPESFKLIKENESYSFRHHISSSVVEFDEFRKENNYSNKLNNKLGTFLMTNSENGGCNSKRIYDLIQFVKLFEVDSSIIPKYCVFQLTHSIRDIDDILLSRDENHLNLLGKEYCDKIKGWSVGNDTFSNEYNLFYPEIYLKTINLITNVFNELEKKYSCKCVFFNGLGDVNLIKSFEDNLKSNPYYFELKKDDVVYMTLLDLSYKNNLTIRKVLGISDDHPSLELHDWLSEELCKKLI